MDSDTDREGNTHTHTRSDKAIPQRDIRVNPRTCLSVGALI